MMEMRVRKVNKKSMQDDMQGDDASDAGADI